MTCIWIFINPETKCNNWENTTENKRITLRNSNTKTAFQRFMANTWTTTRSLHSSFKRAGADLGTIMTSGFLYSRYFNGGARLAQWWDRALALHHYGPGSDPGVDAISGLSFWVRVFLGESKNGFVTTDHTDSLLPKKPGRSEKGSFTMTTACPRAPRGKNKQQSDTHGEDKKKKPT